jgi:hypothetical protein
MLKFKENQAIRHHKIKVIISYKIDLYVSATTINERAISIISKLHICFSRDIKCASLMFRLQ